MKTFHKELWFNIPERMGFINITSDVKTAVIESGIRDGLCLVNAMHITASVFINDDESGLHEDYKRWLEEIAPFDPSPEK
ncbi:MAG: YjbQ family protein, partial [Candidatus Marinimicrobia bacterium]|nr:YjbQ family protein [Candidatus Neomarinimicrobiota bacterium]